MTRGTRTEIEKENLERIKYRCEVPYSIAGRSDNTGDRLKKCDQENTGQRKNKGRKALTGEGALMINQSWNVGFGGLRRSRLRP